VSGTEESELALLLTRARFFSPADLMSPSTSRCGALRFKPAFTNPGFLKGDEIPAAPNL
jgi:hypothetical protein